MYLPKRNDKFKRLTIKIINMVKPLEYDSGISLEEAMERYKEIEEEFEEVRSYYSNPYSGFLGSFRRVFRKNMRREDIKRLSNCFGSLILLSYEKSVQSETGEKPIEDTLIYKIGNLEFEILEYASQFKNTGIRILDEEELEEKLYT
jgi:hypothetical protein